MSDAVCCDNCGETLLVDSRGEDENGERVAWIKVIAANERYDACTRSCAVELLADGGDLALRVDALAEGVADVIRTIREADEVPEGGATDGDA